MGYSAHVNRKVTPQSERARAEQVENSAGGYTFALDKWIPARDRGTQAARPVAKVLDVASRRQRSTARMSLNRSPERLALQAIKYQQLDGWSPAVMTDFIRND